MSGDKLQNYRRQQKLNDHFKNFSHNYQIAYRGPNTAQFQINSPVAGIGMWQCIPSQTKHVQMHSSQYLHKHTYTHTQIYRVTEY